MRIPQGTLYLLIAASWMDFAVSKASGEGMATMLAATALASPARCGARALILLYKHGVLLDGTVVLR